MYYERLLKIFNENKPISNDFPISRIAQLDDFISINCTYQKKILSPFQFANYANIKTSSAIKFFMLFSNQDGIFEMIFYIDCTLSQCSSRVYLAKEDLDDPDNIVYCDECDTSYKVSDILRYVKVNFQIKDIKEDEHDSSFDDNCAYDVLKGCNPGLKGQSPSSLDNGPAYDEGDILQIEKDDVTLEDVVVNNEIQSHPIIGFLSSITAFIHK